MEEYLSTPLISYEEKSNNTVAFSISNVPIIIGLSQIPKEYKILDLKFLASAGRDEYISNENLEKETISDILNILSQNKEYSIDNLELALENGIGISVDEDNDLTFNFPKEYNYKEFIQKILTTYEYNSKTLLPQLIENKNQYLAIEKPDKIIRKYKDFDEYWKSL